MKFLLLWGEYTLSADIQTKIAEYSIGFVLFAVSIRRRRYVSRIIETCVCVGSNSSSNGDGNGCGNRASALNLYTHSHTYNRAIQRIHNTQHTATEKSGDTKQQSNKKSTIVHILANAIQKQ